MSTKTSVIGLAALSVALGAVPAHAVTEGAAGPVTVIRTAPSTPAPTTSFREIVAGTTQSCGVTTAAAAVCWGDNHYGGLGDGTHVNRLRPVQVAGLGWGVRGIGVGSGFACALTSAGGVQCWGRNEHGQLGNRTTTDSATPVQVEGMAWGVVALRVSWANACVIMRDHSAHCWGENANGNLGDGTTIDRMTPVHVRGFPAGVTSISPGLDHSCATTPSGATKCWGGNRDGQLGDGTTIDSLVPVTVSHLTGSVQVVAGTSHSCARTSAGLVACWGLNDVGQLGDGTSTSHTTPVQVVRLRGVDSITTAGEHSCARTSAGAMKCWGSNWSGQLGDGTTIDRPFPVSVIGMGRLVTSTSAGGFHTCALVNTVGKCWGYGYDGELGQGSRQSSAVPLTVL